MLGKVIGILGSSYVVARLTHAELDEELTWRLQRDDLIAGGVPEPRSAALEDAVVRAALVTGAAVRIAPADASALAADGVAALLRYRWPHPSRHDRSTK